jgi:hypothetical protein
MKMKQLPFEGSAVKIKGQTIIIPALSFGQIEELAPKMQKLESDDKMTPDSIGDVIDIVYAAVSRNYEVTRDEIKSILTLRNFREILAAIKGESGLATDEENTSASAGEIQPVV